MQHFLSAVVGGVVVGAVLLLVRRDVAPPTTSVIPITPQLEQPGVVMTPSLDDLYERVRALEARDASGAPNASERVPVEAVAAPDMRARMQALEAELADLRARIESQGLASDWTSNEETEGALESAIDQTQNVAYLERRVRIPLLLRFLERYPQHQGAPGYLEQLVQDYLASQQPKRARAASTASGQTWGCRAMSSTSNA